MKFITKNDKKRKEGIAWTKKEAERKEEKGGREKREDQKMETFNPRPGGHRTHSHDTIKYNKMK